jgi:peptidoglycan hydrolase-like protein with peptidoglycan-binding domain
MSERLIFKAEPFEAYPTFEADAEEYPDTYAEIDTAEEEFGAEPALLAWQDEARRGRSSAGRRGKPRLRTGARGRPPKNRPRAPKRRQRPLMRRPEPLGGVSEPSTDDRPPEGTEYIRWVQSSLNSIMGLQLPIDGIMGRETRSAVRSFQRREGLPVDGIVGPETERALIAARAGQSPAPSGDDADAVDTELAGFGWEDEVDRGSRDYVRWVQRSLNRILGLRLAEDGRMGPHTRSAIRSFQQRQKLNVDGKLGPQTERALVEAGSDAPPSPGIPPKPQAPARHSPGTATGRRYRFIPKAVEAPGGGRIQVKTPPNPNDLVEVKGVGGRRIPLHRSAAEAWQALIGAARADGISEPLLLPTSGFRDPEHQRRLWEQALERYGSPQAARKWVAPPGSSSHQSGRAIDFHLGGKNSSGNVANLKRLPAYKWLVENGVCFGLYPYEAEPWHWEYNPPARGEGETDMVWREASPFAFEVEPFRGYPNTNGALRMNRRASDQLVFEIEAAELIETEASHSLASNATRAGRDKTTTGRCNCAGGAKHEEI